LEDAGPQFNYGFQPYSLTVVRIHATEK